MIDYEILKVIWWLFIGVLLVGFAVMDGQDMGVGTLLPFLGKTDTDRRCMINSVAPHWDGNQVWLLTGGGAMFAAWPLMYATAFSGFYWAMFIVLVALIFRPVGFDFRGKVHNTQWKNTWDWLLFIGSAVPPIIFGVAFGNLLQGVPFHFNDVLRPIYTGSFFGLLNPFGLLCGVLSLVMIVYHGANYLVLRTEGDLQGRAVAVSAVSGVLTAVLFVLGGVWTYFGIDGMVVTGGLDPAGPANPMLKTVELASGAWFSNYASYPVLWIVPALGIVASLVGVVLIRQLKAGLAIVCSGASLLSIILTPLVSMFPFILPSSSDARSSLTIWDCTSSQLTLEVMLFVTLIFLPIVLVYTGWAYRTMSGKLNAEYIRKNDHQLY
ncbi:MAG: cytochrome d ubiquinol oxidase subunit II [Duodenibacillus sp.]|nr:cytochrome d ubiquinol oxidase subunit II [Duodenibacillus sp.]